jgi:membrane-associated phospholipid phosphatase
VSRYPGAMATAPTPAVVEARTLRGRSSVSQRIAGTTAGLWSQRHDPKRQLQVALLVLFASAIAAFAHVVEDYLTGDPIVRWDVELSRWIHAHSSDELVAVAQVLTWAGNVATLALLTAVAAALLVRRGRVNDAVFVCAAALGIEVVNGVLKLVFHRPRPELAFVHLDTYSFPSGHTAGSSAIYALLLYLLVRHRSWGARAAAVAAYVAVVVLVGLTRLYLEVHYLSDVLAGACLGLAWAAACLFVYESRFPDVRRRLPARAQRLLARAAR